MNWKQFLKPDWRKIALTLLILLFFMYYFLLSYSVGGPETYSSKGFPFLYSSGGCVSEIICYDETTYWDKLALDIVIWLIISFVTSCLIIWIYNKFRKRK